MEECPWNDVYKTGIVIVEWQKKSYTNFGQCVAFLLFWPHFTVAVVGGRSDGNKTAQQKVINGCVSQ